MSCQPSSVTQPAAQSERAAVGGKPSARNQERHPLCRWHMRTQIQSMHGKTEERKRERKRGSWICKNTEICIYRIIWRSCNTTWIPEKLECSLNLKTKRLLNHIKYYYLWVIHYLQYIISRKYSENQRNVVFSYRKEPVSFWSIWEEELKVKLFFALPVYVMGY